MEEKLRSLCVCVCVGVHPINPPPLPCLCLCSAPFYAIDMSYLPTLCPTSPMAHTVRHFPAMWDSPGRRMRRNALLPSLPVESCSDSFSTCILGARLLRFQFVCFVFPFAFVFALLTLLSLLPVRQVVVAVVVAFICFVVVRILYWQRMFGSAIVCLLCNNNENKPNIPKEIFL